MTDITFLTPQKDEAILTTHIEVLQRAGREIGVVNGNALSPSVPAAMTVEVDEGRLKIAGEPLDVIAGQATIGAADPDMPRIDIIYRDTSGDVQVVAGTPAVIEDTKGLGAWKSYTSPIPAADIPGGVILGAVYVGAAATSITAGYIWMFAGGVGDLATTIGTPGVDSMPASEKAVRDAIGGFAPAAAGVTNGDTHDHSGGDGGQIAHTALSSIGTNAHSVIDLFIASKAQASGLASLDGGSRVVQNAKLHAADHASGGSDVIKLDDLAAPDANTDLNASTSAHGLMQIYPNTQQRLKGTGGWADPIFGVNFPFGNGSAVLTAEASTKRIPIASKITKAYIRSLDTDGALKTGSITITVYVHDYNAAIGTLVDTFALSSESSFAETGLNITVATGKYITAITSDITTCEQVTLDLEMEAT